MNRQIYIESYNIEDNIINNFSLYKSSIISGSDLDSESNPDKESKSVSIISF